MKQTADRKSAPRPIPAMRSVLPSPQQQVDRTSIRDGLGTLLYFGGCDYFRLSSDPRLIEAAARAVQLYGVSVSASRTTTGNHEVYEHLEAELAAFFGTSAAVLLPNGYSSNLAAAQAWAGQFDLAFIDEQAHGSLWDAARMLDCRLVPFRHLDPAALAAKVSGLRTGARPILLTDGMFALSGHLAPLRAYQAVLPPSAMLLVDDAHAAGVLGAAGQGTVQFEGIRRARIIQTVTLSKAFGAYGGAILGSKKLCRDVMGTSRVFAGSTPVPLPQAEAARTALRILRDDQGLRLRLAQNVRWVREYLRQGGVPVPESPGPILSLRPKSPRAARDTIVQLTAAGIHAPYLHYGAKRAPGCFRFAISSEHTEAQLRRLGTVLTACRDGLRPL